MNYLNYLTFIPLAIGLFISIRHRKLSSFMPLLISGLGLLLFFALVNMVWLFFMIPFLKYIDYSTRHWILIYSAAMPLLNVGGWTMFGAGLGLVLKDVSEKLAFWEEASQNGWRFGANGVRQQENQPEGLEGTEGLEDLLQEEIYRSAFIAPPVQSHHFQPNPTARAEQPKIVVPLGSSNS